MSLPCLATVSLFSIVGSWNDFFSGLIYMTKTENYPLMTYIQTLSVNIAETMQQAGNLTSEQLQSLLAVSDRNLNAAKIVVAVVPLLIIYPLLQKYFVQGIVVGSVKE
jgi:putative aldouronate transport system permease protein